VYIVNCINKQHKIFQPPTDPYKYSKLVDPMEDSSRSGGCQDVILFAE